MWTIGTSSAGRIRIRRRTFSRRQGEYARALGSEVFTPQVVIDGREQLVGSNGRDIQAAIARAAGKPKEEVRIVSAKREGTEAVVTLSIPPLAKGKAEVWVAAVDERDSSSVSKGENSGRSLEHVAVVRTLMKVAAVSRSEGLERSVHLPLGTSPSRVVVFLKGAGGAVVGAESTPIP